MSTIELFRVSCAVADDGCRVRLVGEADFSVLPELTEALEGLALRSGRTVVIDVSELEFIDLACMRALVRFAERAGRAGAPVHVVQPTPAFTLLAGMLGTHGREKCASGPVG